MSIERDQDFEQLEDIAAMMAENPGIEFENGKYVYYGLDARTAFAAVYISGAWAGWQAKVNAVPEGFAIVPVETLNEALSWANCAASESWTDAQREEIDKHYEVIEKSMLAAAQEPK